jgi:hypothetical protein
MSEGKTSISNASTYEEMGEFWDSHEITEYLDQMPEVHFDVNIPSKRRVAVAPSLIEPLTTISQRKGLTLTELVNLWLAEKLREQEGKLIPATK